MTLHVSNVVTLQAIKNSFCWIRCIEKYELMEMLHAGCSDAAADVYVLGSGSEGKEQEQDRRLIVTCTYTAGAGRFSRRTRLPTGGINHSKNRCIDINISNINCVSDAIM